MTVLNVTNATLKGDVKGPTFTGKVDGSSFTGAVTYTDSTTPPPEQGAGPTGGLITAFSAQSNTNSTIDGVNYRSFNANKPYSLKKIDDHTLRFELHPGERCSDTGDSSSVNRTQVDGYQKKYPDNKPFKAAFRIMFEPGAAQNVPWFVLCQYETNEAGTGSPPVAVELMGEKMRIVIRECPVGGDPSNNSPNMTMHVPWTQGSNLKRGQWYVFDMEIKPSQTSGYLKAKLDGAEIVNYTGRVGFGVNMYWTWGLYRAADPGVTIVAQYRNMTVSGG